jgi:hypothetical protein
MRYSLRLARIAVSRSARRALRLLRTMSQRMLFDPNATAHRSPRTRDGRQALACQQQWFDLLAHRAAAIQFGLPVNRSCLSDRCKHRQNRCREKSSFHVSFKTGGKMTPVNVANAASVCQYIGARSFLLSMSKAARRTSDTGGGLKPRGLTGNAGGAVPYSAPRTSARHTRDAAGRRRPPDPGFRRV